MFFRPEERTDTIFFSSAHCTRRRVGDVGDDSLEDDVDAALEGDVDASLENDVDDESQSLEQTEESDADAREVGSVAFGDEEVGSGVTHRSTSETFVKSRRSLKVCI